MSTSTALSRELFQLIGGAPSVAIVPRPRQQQQQQQQQQQPVQKEKARSWKWKPFCNEARTDGLQLNHWAPSDENASIAYKYAHLNVSTEKITFTNEEYDALLVDPNIKVLDEMKKQREQREQRLLQIKVTDESTTDSKDNNDNKDNNGSKDNGNDINDNINDKEKEKEKSTATTTAVVNVIESSKIEEEEKIARSIWTREETEYLLELCHQYDLRFIIIHDRYEYPNHDSSERSIEDLKERYYFIKYKLFENQIKKEIDQSNSSASASNTDPNIINNNIAVLKAELEQLKYNKQLEKLRKVGLEKLYKRTAAQIAEEEALYVELRRIETYLNRLQREREALLNQINTHERVTPSDKIRVPPGYMEVFKELGIPAIGDPGSHQSYVSQMAAAQAAAAASRYPASGGAGGGAAAAAAAAAATAATAGGTQAAASNAPAGADGAGASAGVPPPQKKRRQAAANRRTSNAPSDAAPESVSGVQASATLSTIAASPVGSVGSIASPSASAPKPRPLAAGVHVRSSRIIQSKQPYLEPTVDILSSNGFSVYPAMPTERVVNVWEALLHSIWQYIDMKRSAERSDAELRMMQDRINHLRKLPGASSVKAEDTSLAALAADQHGEVSPAKGSSTQKKKRARPPTNTGGDDSAQASPVVAVTLNRTASGAGQAPASGTAARKKRRIIIDADDGSQAGDIADDRSDIMSDLHQEELPEATPTAAARRIKATRADGVHPPRKRQS